MQVNFYATFRTITGKKTVFFDLAENATAEQLLQLIIDTYPALTRHLLAGERQLHPHVHFLVNGQDIQLLPGLLQTPLKMQDLIDIFPPVAGGY